MNADKRTAGASSVGKCVKREIAGIALSLVLLSAGASPDIAEAQPTIRTLTEQEIVDMIVGNGIYCSRGIDTQGPIDRVTAAFKDGQTFQMIAMADLPNDWLGFSSFGVGGGGAWPEVRKRYEHQLNPTSSVDSLDPERTLSEYVDKTFQTIFSIESGQFPTALLKASRLGIPLVDGDPIGRCVPEIPMGFVNGGVSWTPLAGQTRFGDTFIIQKVRDTYRLEDMTRALAVGSGGSVFVALSPLTGAQLKKNLIPNFHSQAGRVGRAAREAVAARRDPVAAVVAAGNGYLLFTGKVTKSDTRGERGFGRTDAELVGTGKFAGSIYRIYNKNENMIAWRDDQLDAAAPDIIAALDPRTGWAMRGSTTEIGGFVVGDELAIVGLPAAALYRTPAAIEVLGPRNFGFDLEYVPLEKLHKKEGE